MTAPVQVGAFERVGAITLNAGESLLFSAVIDPTGAFAYFASGFLVSPARVAKIDLAAFERVGGITLEEGEDDLISAVIDPAGDFAYFGTDTSPGRVVKIDLDAFERVDAITLQEGENRLGSAVIDPAGAFAYFATGFFVSPGHVVKVLLRPTAPAGLEVDFTPVASDGNGVFEPDEQIAAAPGWRNNRTENAFADGVLSTFTGPTGATYGIVADTVGYGPIPPGETGSCQDSGTGCYELEIQLDEQDRPAPH